jgi:hypothetical protein
MQAATPPSVVLSILLMIDFAKSHAPEVREHRRIQGKMGEDHTSNRQRNTCTEYSDYIQRNVTMQDTLNLEYPNVHTKRLLEFRLQMMKKK